MTWKRRRRLRYAALGIGGAALVAVVIALAAAIGGGDDETAVRPTSVVIAQIASQVTAGGSATGEGLSPTALAATVRVAGAVDGGRGVPVATVDGPGRRLFSAANVALPRGGRPFRIRQIIPSDLGAADASSFVRWKGYVAALSPEEARGARLRARLDWQEASDAAGVRVEPGTTVRLRTMFRIPKSSGACPGAAAESSSAGVRARLRLRRAPAWLVRREDSTQWQWLRVAVGLEQSVAVRTGPRAPVLFQSSRRCVDAAPAVVLDPDPNTQSAPADARLPPDPPDGF